MPRFAGYHPLTRRRWGSTRYAVRTARPRRVRVQRTRYGGAPAALRAALRLWCVQRAAGGRRVRVARAYSTVAHQPPCEPPCASGAYSTPEAGTRSPCVQYVGPRGKLPCASGAYSTARRRLVRVARAYSTWRPRDVRVSLGEVSQPRSITEAYPSGKLAARARGSACNRARG